MTRSLTYIPMTELTTEHRITGADPKGNRVLAVRETAMRVYYTYEFTTSAGEVRTFEHFQAKDSQIAVRTATL